MADSNARLEFLWKASHMLLAQCPGASSHYMSQFLSLSNDRDLRLHEDIQTRSCAACGSIFIPGINAKVKVVPVKETRIEKERRKKSERKRMKMERSKNIRAGKTEVSENKDKTAEAKDSATSIPVSESNSITATTTMTSSKKQASGKESKIIRITPYTELDKQQQQQQQQRRQAFGNNNNQPIKRDKRANQILNHVIYSCQRCSRETELPGTKEGYLTSRIKVSKPVSHRRKMKREQEQGQITAEDATASSGTTSLDSNVKNAKRQLPELTPVVSNLKRPKHSVSMPSSPVSNLGGLSKNPSAGSSAKTSPACSPRLPMLGLDEKKSVGASNKKKKKGGLASLLASQKSSGTSSGSGDNASGSGDSVLANFLMGL
ncbi:hypothetical protein BGX28_007654 [Mortierella sp. GBA30]|nr:hypothetical protein BGX28_007654 [Mortierella sp. GBA30]